MDRLFLDANILFSAAYRPNAGLLRLWKIKNAALCSSRYALEEARVNLQDEDQLLRLDDLSASLLFYEAASLALPKGLSLPEKDAPIFLAAMAARATHFLTGDIRHFGPYFGKKIGGILILPPAVYLAS